MNDIIRVKPESIQSTTPSDAIDFEESPKVRMFCNDVINISEVVTYGVEFYPVNSLVLADRNAALLFVCHCQMFGCT